MYVRTKFGPKFMYFIANITFNKKLVVYQRQIVFFCIDKVTGHGTHTHSFERGRARVFGFRFSLIDSLLNGIFQFKK